MDEHIDIEGQLTHRDGCAGHWVIDYNMGTDKEYDVGYRCSERCGAEVSISVRPEMVSMEGMDDMNDALNEDELDEIKQHAKDRRERAERPGLYPEGKYLVQRLDGKDAPGEKHECCWYFVLDPLHDPHAIAALEAYAESCKGDNPQLSLDLRIKAVDYGED